jgi:DNA primase
MAYKQYEETIMSVFNIIKNKVQILDVIGQHVLLRKAGNYWKGSCPFHSEKTASFTVSPHREIFYCFGCQETGDVISFVSKIEHCSQIEAVKFLAERYGLELPENFSTETTESFDEKKRYFALCSVVANWCHDKLLESPQIMDYVLQRGINHDEINLFKIGYFPHGTQHTKHLLHALQKENFLLKDLIDAGLASEGKTVYSSFEQRIIFPIRDHLGRYCGFGGRIFKQNDERSKYYNSPENNNFQKGSLLFGLDLAKRDIQAKGFVFLVEGYTDCIAMHQHGYKNSVATLGTACTLEHLKALSHHAHTILILYDGDAAGRKAMLRLIELCWQVNLELKVILLPTGFDPASFLKEGKSLEPLITDAQEIFDFFLGDLGKDFGTAPLQQKLSIARNFLDIIKKLGDPFKEDLLLQKASVAFGIPFSSLQQELRSGFKQSIPANKPIEAGHEKYEISTLEKKFICAILSDTQLLKKSSVIRLLQYLPDKLKGLLGKLVDAERSTESETFTTFFETLEDEEKRLVNQILVTESDEHEQEDFEKIEMLLEKKHWKMIVNDTKSQLQKAQLHNNGEAVQEIISSFLDLKKKLLHKGLI